MGGLIAILVLFFVAILIVNAFKKSGLKSNNYYDSGNNSMFTENPMNAGMLVGQDISGEDTGDVSENGCDCGHDDHSDCDSSCDCGCDTSINND